MAERYRNITAGTFEILKTKWHDKGSHWPRSHYVLSRAILETATNQQSLNLYANSPHHIFTKTTNHFGIRLGWQQ